MSFFEFPHTRTYDTDLGWLIKSVHTHDEAINALNEWSENAEIRISTLETFKKELENGNLPDGVRRGILEWCANNIPDMIGAAIKTVFFDITQDGYLRITIPDSWDDITWGTTGLDTYPPGYNYGHLTINY